MPNSRPCDNRGCVDGGDTVANWIYDEDEMIIGKKEIEVGQKLRLDYGNKNLNSKLYHVANIFQDMDYDTDGQENYFVVLKHWLRRRKYWVYVVKDFYWLEGKIQEGWLKHAS